MMCSDCSHEKNHRIERPTKTKTKTPVPTPIQTKAVKSQMVSRTLDLCYPMREERMLEM